MGDHIMGEQWLSFGRYWLSRVLRKARILAAPLPQIVPGPHYWFDLLIRSDIHALTVWRATDRQPPPQIIVSKPAALLPTGPAGIIAHRCAVRVYAFEVSAS